MPKRHSSRHKDSKRHTWKNHQDHSSLGNVNQNTMSYHLNPLGMVLIKKAETANAEKQIQCPLLDKWIKKMCSAIKRSNSAICDKHKWKLEGIYIKWSKSEGERQIQDDHSY